MKASDFVAQLRRKFPVQFESGGDRAIALRLGLSLATVRKWARSDSELQAFQITNAFLKAQDAAVADAEYETIRPLVEFFPIRIARSKRNARFEILPLKGNASTIEEGIREVLKSRHGLYIFYDSRGRALYAGKAKRLKLWGEMNNAFNRSREEVQKITLVKHPERNQEFVPGYEKSRRPKSTELKLFDLATYFSAYWVTEGMIDDLEALLVRGFANDLLNIRMEKFAHLKDL